jgi:hypothetical protein
MSLLFVDECRKRVIIIAASIGSGSGAPRQQNLSIPFFEQQSMLHIVKVGAQVTSMTRDNRISWRDRRFLWCAGDNTQLEHNAFSAADLERL